MLKKIQSLQSFSAKVGPTNATLYALSRLFESLGGFVSLERYVLVAQPVRAKPILRPHRGRSIDIRQVAEGDPALAAMPLTEADIRFRFTQGTVCLGAFSESRMIGCLWLCLGSYDEDEVRCRFVPLPEGRSVWDFDVYIHPEYRSGIVFARLWDAANTYLCARGVAWSMSRISAFNPMSLYSHRSLDAKTLGTATFISVGRLQLLFSSCGPGIRLSAGPKQVPHFELSAPER